MRKVFFGLIALTIATGSLFFYFSQKKEAILCIEVGHTRIKAAILPQNPTLQELKKIQVFTCPSKPWLQKNLEKLFQKNRTSPLYELLIKRPSKISLSLFGPIYDNSRFGREGEKNVIPLNVKEALEKEIGSELHIESDSVSWAIGALEYLKLQSSPISFPCLAITLGTGVGVAIIENEHRVAAFELWSLSLPLPRLELFTEKRPAQNLFGKKYLEALFREEEFEKKMTSYSSDYNLQLRAFIEDLKESIFQLFSIRISSVLIGGGYSRFIPISQEEKPSIIVLNPQKLEQDGVSCDLIQLLGCQKQMQKNPITTWTYPPEK